MDKQDAAIEELHARCDALESCLGTLVTAFIGQSPKAASFLEDLFRENAKEARTENGHPIQIELLDRWAEWMAQEKESRAAAGTRGSSHSSR